jgi:hypothetical protein
MRLLPLAAALAMALATASARSAAAQEIVPVIEPPAAPLPTPVRSAGPAAGGDAARVRALQEQLFAREALRFDGRRITKGDVPLKPGTLYATVGRPELAAQIRTRRIAKGITIGAGIGVAAVGTVWGVADSAATAVNNGIGRTVNLCGTSETTGKCADREEASMIPWLVAFGGGMVALIGGVVPSDPLDSLQKSVLIDDYNQRLRAGIGLSSALQTARRTATVRAAAQPDGQSGMLLAGCSF